MSGENVARDYIDQWYDQYSAAIYKYIVKMLKDVQNAEDLTQETFVKAYYHLARQHRVNYPKAFLYRTAHNLTVDYLRKRQPIYVVKEMLTNTKDSKPSTESLIEIEENSKELQEALLSLKPSHRQVIILRKIEEFSVRETAQILNCSEGKVKSSLYRALQKLEDKLIQRGFINETR